MRNALRSALAISTIAVSSLVAQPYSDDTEFTILTSDSLVVYGDLYDPNDEQPLILLFHQAGGNGRAEYGAIVPRLLEEGFSAIAIDQRLGGGRLGGVNRTVEAATSEATSYCQAEPDLEAALDYAVEAFKDRPVVLWGSSYSAALVIRLANKRSKDVSGVLAFSPASGDPMEGCRPEAAASTLNVPAMMLRPRSEMEFGTVGEQLAGFAAQGHQTFVAENGVHGSSMLNVDRVKEDTEPTWTAVLTFLRSLGNPQP